MLEAKGSRRMGCVAVCVVRMRCDEPCVGSREHTRSALSRRARLISHAKPSTSAGPLSGLRELCRQNGSSY